jgi:hypothetical protein
VALLDEEFLEVWLRAAYRCGRPARAREIGLGALEAATRLDRSADFWVRRLIERMVAEESSGSTAFPAATAAAGQRSAMSAPAAPEPAAMHGPGSTFTFNNAGAVIGQQVGALTGSIIINENGPAGRQQAGQQGATGSDGPDEDAGDQGA